MSDDVFAKHKLTDAIPQPAAPEASSSGAPSETPGTIAEQTREMQESRSAENAQVAQRDRLVEIGKSQHMAGRGNGRRSDS